MASLPPDAAEQVRKIRAIVEELGHSVASPAEVREMQLRLKFNFRARTPGGRELIPRAELLVSRDLSYRESAALAKEREEEALFRAMQLDVIEQTLRRLAAVTL